ncbi:MAG: hypothetical protein ACT4PE_05165 [Candidatus Eiseniibacteriota bacterium]
MSMPNFVSPRAWLPLLVLAASCGDDNPAAPGADDDAGPPAGLRFVDFQAAAVVIGQSDKGSGTSNAGGSTNAVGMIQPYGAGSGSFYVTDQLNSRVLGFAGVPGADGMAASFVLGQPDFSSNNPGTSAQSFEDPFHCVVAGGKLFVVDTGNQRVLIWNSLPTSNVPADVVVGQPDFDSSDPATTQAGLAGPVRAAVAGSRLIVCDSANHRVLIWNTIPTANGAPADVVLGQTDFTSAVPGMTASRFTAPWALWTDGTRVVVGDTGNRRVLIWSSFPTSNGEPADVVVGAADFSSAGGTTPSATSINHPAGAASDGTSLFIADQVFERVLIFTPFPTENGAAATGVLGQASFTNVAPNDANQDGVRDSGPTARTFLSPVDVTVVGDRLLVADHSNNRVLVFDGSR